MCGAGFVGAKEAGLAVVRESGGRDWSAGHVVLDGGGDFGIGSELLQGLVRPDLAPGPAEGSVLRRCR